MTRIITLIDQITRREIRAPRQIVHPMSRDDAAFWELRKERAEKGQHNV